MGTVRWSVVAIVVGAGLMITLNRASAQNAASTSKPADSPAGNAENGKRVFMSVGCFSCHGTLGHDGGGGGPKIGPDALPFKAFAAYLRNPKEMPPYTEKVMSDQEVADVYAYLKSVPRSPDLKSIPLLNEK